MPSPSPAFELPLVDLSARTKRAVKCEQPALVPRDVVIPRGAVTECESRWDRCLVPLTAQHPAAAKKQAFVVGAASARLRNAGQCERLKLRLE